METLRCMQALVVAQTTRARAHRARTISEPKPNQNQSTYRKSTENDSFKHMYNEMDISIKIVEMDVCGNSRSRNSSANHELYEHRDCNAESMAYDYPLYPNYMANTESSRAKLRSHSAPKQRPVRMQRSSSLVGVTVKDYQYPCSIKLDKSTVSLKDSECGSTSTMLTNSNYCTSFLAYDVTS
ncbi:hypothetical protein Lal_00032935 [Lupinus albus]|nr:hypothetical protein Lal_00032935 [Lupinus albus]